MDGGEGMALSGAERGRNLMKAERWKKVNDLFQSALERAPEERAAFLDESCHGDEDMRREVESLLTSHERAENFIEVPAFEVAPELATNDSADALVGKLLGHYRIESLIGVGGMGEVYLARDEGLGRKAALKLLPDSLTTDETQLGRFKNEARSASALNHPNILTVYEIGAEGNMQFIATEFIEGVTLRAALASGRMSAHSAVEIAVQVASALAAAHDVGVVHRDIKPENIMLRPDGYAKVLDFGIAKLTEQRLASDDRTSRNNSGAVQTRPGISVRHGALHVSGTGARTEGGRSLGHLEPGRSALRNGGREPAVSRRDAQRLHCRHPDSGASTFIRHIPKCSGSNSNRFCKRLCAKTLMNVTRRSRRCSPSSAFSRRNSKRKARCRKPNRVAILIVSEIKRPKRGVLVTLVVALFAAAAVACFFFFFVPGST